MRFLKPYQKSVATGVAVCFSISLLTLSPVALGQLVQVENISLSSSSLSFVPLGIPPELGSIEEVFIPGSQKGDAFPLVHIQSVHAHPETQKKIYGLLKFLDEKYGINSLFIEGAGEELNPAYFQFFDDNRLNVRVAEKLIEKGELTGAELFLIESDKKIPAYGLENPSLYQENLMSFQSVMSQRNLTSHFTQGTHAVLDRLETLLLKPEARRLLRSSESFDAGQLALLSYVLELERKSRTTLGLDLRHFESQIDWPQMIRILRLQELESKLEPEKIQSDRQRLTSQLKEMRVESSLIEAFENLSFSPFQSGMVYDPGFRKNDLPRYLAERLAARTLEKGFSFEQYPYFTRFIEAAILQSELEAERLFGEMERLYETLTRTVSNDEDDWRLVEYVHQERLLERLFDLELTSKDYAKVETFNQDGRPLVRFLLGIESLHERTRLGAQKFVPTNIQSLESVYSHAIRFYQLAKEREETMVEKIQTSQNVSASSGTPPRNDHKPGVSVLITGGFHTDGLSRAFRKKQIPYTLISPHITEKVSAEAYVSALLGEKKTAFDVQYLERAEDMQHSGMIRREYPQNLRDQRIRAEIRTVLEAVLETARAEIREGRLPISADRLVDILDKSLYFEDRQISMRRSELRDKVVVWEDVANEPVPTLYGNPLVIPIDTLTIETPVLATRSAPPMSSEQIAKEFGLSMKSKTPHSRRAEVRAGMQRVLVVDDDQSIRTMAVFSIKSWAQKNNRTVDIEEAQDAANAKLKYETARQAGKPFDFVLNDLEMGPGENGAELAQWIHPIAEQIKSQGLGNKTLVIVWSGNPNALQAHSGLVGKEIFQLVNKPASLEPLLNQVDTELSRPELRSAVGELSESLKNLRNQVARPIVEKDLEKRKAVVQGRQRAAIQWLLKSLEASKELGEATSRLDKVADLERGRTKELTQLSYVLVTGLKAIIDDTEIRPVLVQTETPISPRAISLGASEAFIFAGKIFKENNDLEIHLSTAMALGEISAEADEMLIHLRDELSEEPDLRDEVMVSRTKPSLARPLSRLAFAVVESFITILKTLRPGQDARLRASAVLALNKMSHATENATATLVKISSFDGVDETTQEEAAKLLAGIELDLPKKDIDKNIFDTLDEISADQILKTYEEIAKSFPSSRPEMRKVQEKKQWLTSKKALERLQADKTFEIALEKDQKFNVATGTIPESLRRRLAPTVPTPPMVVSQGLAPNAAGEFPIPQPLLASLRGLIEVRPYAATLEPSTVIRAVTTVATRVSKRSIWSEEDMRIAGPTLMEVSRVWASQGVSSHEQASKAILRALSAKTSAGALMAKAHSRALTAPGASVMIFNRMLTRAELRATLISTILSPVLLEIVFTPGVVTNDEDRQNLVKLREEAQRLVPDGRVNIVYAKNPQELNQIFSGMASDLHEKAVDLLHAQWDVNQFKNHILVNVEKTVWDELALHGLIEEGIQRALYNFDWKKNPVTLGQGSFLSATLVLDVLPDQEKRKIAVGPGNYFIKEEDFSNSPYLDSITQAVENLLAVSYSA